MSSSTELKAKKVYFENSSFNKSSLNEFFPDEEAMVLVEIEPIPSPWNKKISPFSEKKIGEVINDFERPSDYLFYKINSDEYVFITDFKNYICWSFKKIKSWKKLEIFKTTQKVFTRTGIRWGLPENKSDTYILDKYFYSNNIVFTRIRKK